MYDWEQPKPLLGAWRYPPKTVDTTVINLFADELPTIAEHKVLEASQRLKTIEKEHRLIIKDTPANEPDRQVYIGLESVYHAEKLYILKWLDYWVKVHDLAKGIEPFKKIKINKKITNKQIQKTKNYPIQDLYDGNLRQNGHRFLGLCPFHVEKTPSFTIYDDGHAKCFGCQWYGNAIDFVMKRDGIDFVEAVRRLQ